MGKLIAVKMPRRELPCHMHNCFNPIAYKLVHVNYPDSMGMEIAMICEDCAQGLVESLAVDMPGPEPVVEEPAPTPKRGRPKNDDVRKVRA